MNSCPRSKFFLRLFLLVGVGCATRSLFAEPASEATTIETKRLRLSVAELKHQIARLETELVSVQQQAGALLTDFERVSREISDNKVETASLKTKISSLQGDEASATKRSHFSSILLMMGLFIEILGATLLAGSALAAEQYDVLNIRVTHRSFDLGMRDTAAEPLFSYLSAVGTLFIFTGFVLQFAGTLISLNLGPASEAALILLGVLVPVALLTFLAGQTPKQTRIEKARIVLRNTRRVFLAWIVDPLLSTVRCDICLGRISLTTANVSWQQESNTPAYPFLHRPHRFRLGHVQCLETDKEEFTGGLTASKEINDKAAKDHQFESAAMFLQTMGPRLQAWLQECLEHWNTKWATPARDFKEQAELAGLMKRLRKLR